VTAWRLWLLAVAPWVRAVDQLAATPTSARDTSPRLGAIDAELKRFVGTDGWNARRFLFNASPLNLVYAGALHTVIAIATLWDFHWLAALRRQLTPEALASLQRASLAVGELEFLVALGDASADYPDTVFAQVAATGPVLSITDGAHVLLPPATGVRNTVTLGGDDGPAVVVTGSNMAGKSTFLRMLGSHAVLALAGAPVRATAMTISPLSILTDVNLSDSLNAGRSYFQTEAARVARIMQLAMASRQHLVILDELFRGTNSRERIAAGLAVVETLARSGVLLVVATHEHEYATMAATSPGMRNAHFEERYESGTMRFPYALLDGPSSSTNALRVLEGEGMPSPILERANAILASGGQATSGASDTLTT
jgi:DNA mismatch repair ATPase MutS